MATVNDGSYLEMCVICGTDWSLTDGHFQICECKSVFLPVVVNRVFLQVNGDFVLMVNLVNYTNPSGLCAECNGTTLDDVTTADQLIPVCCDEATSTSNCDNTGDARCDTRFRWTIRLFGASLETRPASIPNATNPPYFFTNCALSPTSCPFSEMSAISQGPTAFLGVTDNPLNISKPDFTIWKVSLCSFNSDISCLYIGTNTVLHRASG